MSPVHVFDMYNITLKNLNFILGGKFCELLCSFRMLQKKKYKNRWQLQLNNTFSMYTNNIDQN